MSRTTGYPDQWTPTASPTQARLLQEVPGLRVPPGTGGIAPYQLAGVEYLARARRSFLCDQVGLGKTVQALATAKLLEAFPFLILCPAFAKGVWEDEVAKWLEGVRTFRVDAGDERPWPRRGERVVVVVNYEILARYLVEAKDPKGRPRFTGEFSDGFLPAGIAFDESHYCKNRGTKRTKAARAIARGPHGGPEPRVVLCLTATPVENRPAEFVPQIEILRREKDVGGKGGSWAILNAHCNPNGFGRPDAKTGHFDFSGAVDVAGLLRKLRATCYVRRTKAEVQGDLPEKRTVLVPLEISNRAEYLAEEKRVLTWREGMDPDDFAGQVRAQAMVKMEVLKQLAARGKMAQAREWLASFLESSSDEKLVVFTTHVESLALAIEAAGEIVGPAAVTGFGGDVPPPEREAMIARFHSDPTLRVLAANLRAGGVSIDLTPASNVAFLEMGWTWSAHEQAEGRLHRKGQRRAVTAHYLVARGTVEEEIYELIQAKRRMGDLLVDGRALEAGGPGSDPVWVDALWRLRAAAGGAGEP